MPKTTDKDNVIVHKGTKDALCKNEDVTYKKLKNIKYFISRQHPTWKRVIISTPITRVDNKKTNTTLKRYLNQLKEIEVNSVILNDNIRSSHLNKDGFVSTVTVLSN